MDKSIDNNIAEFMKAINRDAFIECKKIEVQTNEFTESQIALAKEELKRNLQRNKAYKLNKMHSETNIKISNEVSKMRKELIISRENMMLDVFKEVKEKIINFTKSDKYLDFLLNSTKKASEVIKGANIVIQLKEDDMKFSDEIKKAMGVNCSFEIDKSNYLGGLKISSENMIIDDTFENRLSEQDEWFMMNSGLSIV